MDKVSRKRTCWLIALLSMLLAFSAFTLPAQNAHAANTSLGNATKMTQGTTYWATLGYDRYYRIDVPTDGVATLTFGKKADGLDDDYHNGHKASIYRYENGTTKNVVENIDALGKSSIQHKSTPIGLKKGTYFLKISKCPNHGNKCAETVKYNFSKTNNWEKEDNNAPSTATRIDVSQTLSGNIPSDYDEDWYRISIPKTGWYSYNFSRSYAKEGSGSSFSWRCHLYKTTDGTFSNDLLKNLFVESDGSGTKCKQIKLSKGDYYIQVKQGIWHHDAGASKYSLSMNKVTGPKTTKISKSKAGKKSFKVYWNKKSNVNKYEVRISTKKSMSGSAYYTASKSKGSLSVKKLTSKKWPYYKPIQRHKKYYVQIRSIKTLDTPTGHYDLKSSWSKVKTVKTK